MFLSKSASAAVLREAERAQRNRLEIIRCLSHGQAPPVLELIVEFGGVKARGLHSGQAYEVESLTIVRRPLQSFEQVEVGISYAPTET